MLRRLTVTSATFGRGSPVVAAAAIAPPPLLNNGNNTCMSGGSDSSSSTATVAVAARRFFGGGSKNPYTTLGLKMGASKADIKKAYRMMAAKNHPDAPGGSNEKFQEIQAAYEQIKTGVWVPPEGEGGGGGGGGGGGTNSKYGGFQWYTDGKRSNKVSYDRMQQRMHQGTADKAGPSFDDDEEAGAAGASKSRFRNPMGASDEQVQAWFRFITAWAALFVTLRIVLFLLFPPKHQHAPKKPLPERPRKPPPPKPIQHTPLAA